MHSRGDSNESSLGSQDLDPQPVKITIFRCFCVVCQKICFFVGVTSHVRRSHVAGLGITLHLTGDSLESRRDLFESRGDPHESDLGSQDLDSPCILKEILAIRRNDPKSVNPSPVILILNDMSDMCSPCMRIIFRIARISFRMQGESE